MQFSEDLIRQITEEVVRQLDGTPAPKNGNSLAGKDRINEKKTSYGYTAYRLVASSACAFSRAARSASST